jgi:hypothetical protein
MRESNKTKKEGVIVSFVNENNYIAVFGKLAKICVNARELFLEDKYLSEICLKLTGFMPANEGKVVIRKNDNGGRVIVVNGTDATRYHEDEFGIFCQLVIGVF